MSRLEEAARSGILDDTHQQRKDRKSPGGTKVYRQM